MKAKATRKMFSLKIQCDMKPARYCNLKASTQAEKQQEPYSRGGRRGKRENRAKEKIEYT